jgi:4,5-dihydroxyphthalate decarboxylase
LTQIPLRTAIGTFGHSLALKDGRVSPAGFRLEHVDVDPMIAAYRRMVRDLEFDVSEMAPTTYLIAKEHGLPFTGIPVFLNRKFHHEDIMCRTAAKIERPGDIRGKRVGVRAYTVTTGVWARGILAHEYGIAPDDVHWVTDDEEHVAAYVAPSNVEAAAPGRKLAELFAEGSIDAAFSGPAGVGGALGQGAAGTMHPLFPNAAEMQRAWYERTGIYPLHSMVVVRNSVLEAHPDVVGSLMAAFAAAKQLWLDGLNPTAGTADERRLAAFRSFVGPDPLPYGNAANRPSIDALIMYAVEQGLIHEPPVVDDVFLEDCVLKG